MPTNPNIIMQAGRGVTPIRRRDPMGEAVNAYRLKNEITKSNALRDQSKQSQQMKTAISQGSSPYDVMMGAGDWEGAQSYRTNRLANESTQATMDTNKRSQSDMEDYRAVQDTLNNPTPERWRNIVTMMAEDGLDTSQFTEQPDIEFLTKMRDGFEQKLGTPAQNRTQRQGVAKDTQAQSNADRSYSLAVKRFEQSKNRKGMTLTTDNEGNVTFTQGGNTGETITAQPLEKSVVRTMQSELSADWATVGRLQRIKDMYDPDFLTFKGRLSNQWAEVMDKSGMSSKEQRSLITKRRRFTQNVDREFNAYRKLITGAAASVQEMEDLKKAMMSVDNGPTQFEAAFNEYSLGVARSMRLKSKLLREGIKVSDKQFGNMFDELFLSGADDSLLDRAQELEAEGKSEEEGTAILVREGYIPPVGTQ